MKLTYGGNLNVRVNIEQRMGDGKNPDLGNLSFCGGSGNARTATHTNHNHSGDGLGLFNCLTRH